MSAGALSVASLVFGIGWIAMTVWPFVRARRTPQVPVPEWAEWVKHGLGVAFGVTWAGEAIARRTVESGWWLGAVVGILAAVLSIVLLGASARPQLARKLGLPIAWDPVQEHEAGADVEALARSGETIRAVRAYRAQTGAGLKEASEVVRALQREGDRSR